MIGAIDVFCRVLQSAAECVPVQAVCGVAWSASSQLTRVSLVLVRCDGRYLHNMPDNMHPRSLVRFQFDGRSAVVNVVRSCSRLRCPSVSNGSNSPMRTPDTRPPGHQANEA